MANFKKGESYKNQRVYMSASFDQKRPRDGKNLMCGIANDTKSAEDSKSAPMLVYDSYTDKEGNRKPIYTAGYSKKQWEKIEEMGNKDGDCLVVEADLIPNKNGKGLVINTETLKTPEEPFDKKKHKENTYAKRELNKQRKIEKQMEKDGQGEQLEMDA